jgi:23S rRNA (adenine-N6)-dimethyltransferase
VSARPSRTRRRVELSQHFLRRGTTAARLLASTSIRPRDLVLEIGPGRGALTRALLSQRARLIAVEIDPLLAARLREELGARAEIVDGDFLRFELPAEPYKVVGSLPFSRTSEIVRRLTSAAHAPQDAWLVVQREAARRFAGSPWGRETRFSLGLKPWWHCEILAALRRVDFDPPPVVESVWLWASRRSTPLVAPCDAARYRALSDQLLATGPTLRGSLRRWLSRAQIARLARDLHFDPAAPPSSLRFEQWLALFRFLSRT